MLTTGPRGTNDIMPGEVEKWRYLEGVVREMCRLYNYAEIRTPIFEHTELFQRGVGETTDIVEKEMYTFNDRGDRSITLRPEGTASTVRAYLEHKRYGQAQPQKFFYIGPMFRYDRPQAGRFRQFHQFGVEVLGTQEPALDAEVIMVAVHLLQKLGLNDLEVHLNSIGCPSCRQAHREQLTAFLAEKLEGLCTDCRSRFARNPLRILDCKNPRCKELTAGAPTMLDCLCDDCSDHFAAVRRCLEILDIKYTIDPGLVRGLDYYTKTVFEIMYSGLGAQSTVCGGGRYDGLVAECGGPDTPGIGFAMGLERVLLTLEKSGIALPVKQQLDVFIATLGEGAKTAAFKLLYALRERGLAAEQDYLGRSLKAQMKYADKFNVHKVVILGENELANGIVPVRDMTTGDQTEVKLDELVEYLADAKS